MQFVKNGHEIIKPDSCESFITLNIKSLFFDCVFTDKNVFEHVKSMCQYMMYYFVVVNIFIVWTLLFIWLLFFLPSMTISIWIILRNTKTDNLNWNLGMENPSRTAWIVTFGKGRCKFWYKFNKFRKYIITLQSLC